MYIGPGPSALAPSASVKVMARLDKYQVLWQADLLQYERVCVFAHACVCVKDKPGAIGRSLKRVVQKNQ